MLKILLPTIFPTAISEFFLIAAVTEVNNSYFECKTLNYDIEKIKNENEFIEKKIQETDFEISKLNSIEFEVNI